MASFAAQTLIPLPFLTVPLSGSRPAQAALPRTISNRQRSIPSSAITRTAIGSAPFLSHQFGAKRHGFARDRTGDRSRPDVAKDVVVHLLLGEERFQSLAHLLRPNAAVLANLAHQRRPE